MEVSIKREEHLQDKYKSEITDAIKINKDLNDLVIKKNQHINKLSIISKKKELVDMEKINSIKSQTMDEQNKLTKYLEDKENEIRRIAMEKNNILSCTSKQLLELEEQRRKFEIKSEMLEEENKTMVFELKNQLKKIDERSPLNK